MKKENLEPNLLKNSYRHFLSDITPGFLLFFVIFFVLGIELPANSNQTKEIVVYFLIASLSIPFSLIINASSYIFLNRLIRTLMLWSLKHKYSPIRYCFFPGEFTDNKIFWNYFMEKNKMESFLHCLYSISKIITLSGNIILTNQVGRIRGLEILCRSLSFLLLVLSFAGQSWIFFFSSLCISVFLFILSACLKFIYFNDIFTYAKLAYAHTKGFDWVLEFEESKIDQKLAELKKAFCEYIKSDQ